MSLRMKAATSKVPEFAIFRFILRPDPYITSQKIDVPNGWMRRLQHNGSEITFCHSQKVIFPASIKIAYISIGPSPNLRLISNGVDGVCLTTNGVLSKIFVWKGGTWSELNRTKVYSISKKLNSAKVGDPLYLNNSHVVRAKPLHCGSNALIYA